MTQAIPRVLRDPRTARAWFAFEAASVIAFWATLLILPELRSAFIVDRGGQQLLWAFASADSTIVLACSVAAIGAARRAEWTWVAMLVATATWSYPAIYLLSVAIAGHGAVLSAVLMLPVALVNVAFTIAARNPDQRVESRLALPAPASWNVVKTGAELLVLWAALLWLMPTLIDRFHDAMGWSVVVPEVSRAFGMALLAAGTGLLAWSALVMAWKGDGTPFPFDAPRRLVLDGPYRYVRNPQVIGGVLQGLSLVLFDWSPVLLLCIVAGVALWQVVLRPWEEADLSVRFGEAYGAYRRNVRCWRPRLAPYSAGDFGRGTAVRTATHPCDSEVL